jgi:N-acylglucosamine 2-epimerase
MWFQMHIARDRGDSGRTDKAVELIRRHVELGWDEQFGGLLLAVDADGRDDVGWEFADTKLWWPHTEAMYALLLAYEHTGADWCLQWYRRVHEYSFSHYPVAEHGEWRQKLQRDGTPLTQTVALPVKDPFHLPRALIYCVDVLDRLTN